MNRVSLFSGTTEGRNLAMWLAENKIDCIVSVATEYGKMVMEPDPNITLLEGRMDEKQMLQKIGEMAPDCVIDATHPFATVVTASIQACCTRLEIPYYRVSREMEEQVDAEEGVLFFRSMAEAAGYLKEQKGNIFLTTGSKELALFTDICTDVNRIYARVLPSVESIELCERAGICGKHILAMQGPFSVEMNMEMLKLVKAAYLVTKETGGAGGYVEKIQAAKAYGCRSIIIENPEKRDSIGKKYSLTDIKEELCKLYLR